MIIIPLFINILKKNWGLLLIFFSVLSMYVIVMSSTFDPKQIEALLAMVKLMPKELMDAMGFNKQATDLTGFLASWLYGILMFGFPMVYCIILANKLVLKKIENNSFSYYLSTPHSRTSILFTLGIYGLTSLLILFILVYFIGLASCEILFPELLNKIAFLKLNFTTMLVNMVVFMISFLFFSSCQNNKVALILGTGIPILFLLMYMIGGASSKLSTIKNLSIYGLYNPVDLVNGSSVFFANILYIFIITILFCISLIIFKKRNLKL